MNEQKEKRMMNEGTNDVNEGNKSYVVGRNIKSE